MTFVMLTTLHYLQDDVLSCLKIRFRNIFCCYGLLLDPESHSRDETNLAETESDGGTTTGLPGSNLGFRASVLREITLFRVTDRQSRDHLSNEHLQTRLVTLDSPFLEDPHRNMIQLSHLPTEMCGICLGDFRVDELVASLEKNASTCESHIFHSSCLLHWVESCHSRGTSGKEKITCPLCRREVRHENDVDLDNSSVTDCSFQTGVVGSARI